MTILTATDRPGGPREPSRLSLAAHAATRGDLAERAAAHCRQRLTRRAQHFQNAVTEVETVTVMFAIEAGYDFVYGVNAWRCRVKLPLGLRRAGIAVAEMTRTGLVRDYRSPATGERVLLPAPVHLAARGLSACLFVGEDLGPMRARLAGHVSLVDCRECLALAGRPATPLS